MPGTGNDRARPSVYPALHYRDASAAIDWLSRAFGLEVLARYEGPDGAVAHAELTDGTGVIMLGPGGYSEEARNPRDLPGFSQSVYVAVADPDAHHARAKAAGAEITREPGDTDYGSREYACRDLEGHWWSFGTFRPAPGDPPLPN